MRLTDDASTKPFWELLVTHGLLLPHRTIMKCVQMVLSLLLRVFKRPNVVERLPAAISVYDTDHVHFVVRFTLADVVFVPSDITNPIFRIVVPRSPNKNWIFHCLYSSVSALRIAR